MVPAGRQKVNSFTREHLVGLNRLEQGENLEENQKNLRQITERFFQAIVGSSSEFPPQLRSVCHCLYQVRCCPTSLSSLTPLPQPPSCSLSLSALLCVSHFKLLPSPQLRRPNASQTAAFYSANINPLLYLTCPHSFFSFFAENTNTFKFMWFLFFPLLVPANTDLLQSLIT